MGLTKPEWEKTAETPANQLSMDCLRELGYSLNSDLDKLADKLNVSNDKLRELKLKDNPGKEILHNWANTPDTTVFVLYCVLKGMEKYDAVGVLSKHLIGEIDITLLVHTNSLSKVHTPKVAPTVTLKEVVQKIPELEQVPLGDIKCTMDNPPENYMEKTAKYFKGKQISLSTSDKPRVNSEPIQGSETDKPKRHTSPKYPVQECHQLSSNADEVALVDCSLNATSLGMLNCISDDDADDSDTCGNKLIHKWPALTSYEIAKVLGPRLKQPGTYILRHSRESNLLSINVVHDGNIISFRIHGSDGHDSVWLFERAEKFLGIKELVDYYSKHPMCQTGEKEGPLLKRAI